MTTKIPAIVRLVDKSSPIHGDDRGTYVQIAVPNMARYAFGKTLPNFDKPYKLENDVLFTSTEDLERALARWLQSYDITVYSKE